MLCRGAAVAASFVLLMGFTNSPAGGELRLCLRSEPRTFDPLMVEDESSEVIRYLTGGVLVRINRATQQAEPELAVSWQILENGRRIDFRLRRDVRFSDGTPFTAQDVAYTMRRVMDRDLHAPAADAFRSGNGTVTTTIHAPDSITIRFGAPVAGLPAEFDQLPVLSSVSPLRAEMTGR